MDCMQEAIALGIDALIFGLCLKGYYSHKHTVNALKAAPELALDANLKDHVTSQRDQTVPYAVVRGTVRSIGAPITSAMSPSVTGVVQVITLNEHRVTRAVAGFWTEQTKVLHVSSSEVPFRLVNVNTDFGVEIADALSSEILDMDVVYDNYEPSALSFFDHVFGFFTGIRQKGFQTTEEILRDGSFITAIGELKAQNDSLTLQPSNAGPMFLTTATKGALLRRFEDAKTSMLTKAIFCGAIAALITAYIGRKIYLRKKQERAERRLKETLERERRERRQRSRVNPGRLSEDQKCVVCVTNPKEVICLPCGHVCLCEDCASKINLKCPVCRAKIENKAAAFIS